MWNAGLSARLSMVTTPSLSAKWSARPFTARAIPSCSKAPAGTTAASRASPPLWLTLPDGEVTIQAGYHLGNVPHTLKTASDREYTGIQVGDPVLVLGTLGAKAVGDAPPQIQAETVTVETVDGYLASLTTNKRIFQGMGAGFLVAGTGLLLGSMVSVGYTLRQG
jgi:hypothetical protein